ncbi:type IX secretion/gliding motility protein PorT/SprT [Psychroflexus sediminis]|uniref:Probable protein-translocating porin PorT n=1 Tax=Psychroflexus sediminis TaxID=470826 RepID=A0A1G7VDZ0_9FLAO|nr:porin family protein [Psychroflexus sediminis]SDG57927.1 probable protein-translocating porin PorT [Psychroflexus sediminis]
MRFLIVLIFLLGYHSTSAQLFSKEKVLNKENFDKPRWSWGYFLGSNVYDFQIKYRDEMQDIEVEKSPSFNVGLIGNLRINDYLDLRLEPGVVFSNRTLAFQNFDNENDRIREVNSTYIHIPLLLKFSSKRINNFKPFMVGGASISHNLSSNEDNPQDNSAGQFRLKTQNYYYEVGFGIDFYFDYFKFTPSIRGVFGMTDELVRDEDPNSPWTSNIESLKTRGIFINFTFQ